MKRKKPSPPIPEIPDAVYAMALEFSEEFRAEIEREVEKALEAGVPREDILEYVADATDRRRKDGLH